MKKTLIAYFSASGETGKLAKTLSAVTGGDLFEIRPETAYTSADLNWMDKKSRSTIEMKDEHSRPAHRGPRGGYGAVRHRVRRLPDLVVSGAAHHRDVS